MNAIHSSVAVHAFTAVPALAVLLVGGCDSAETFPSPEANMQGISEQVGAEMRMQVDRIGRGSPLVLIGGGLTGWSSWQPHAEILSVEREVARLQLISVEYGLEDRPLPEGYSVATESRALAAALDHLGWTQPVDFAAWSYGAAATLDFALSHPERVRSLTLIEPPALWVLPDHGRALPDVQELQALLPGVEGDVDEEALIRFLITAALVPPGASPQTLPQWDTWFRHRRSLRNGDAVFQHDDDPARLSGFAPPVLLVTGNGTSPFLRAVHDTLAAKLPVARTLKFPGGHAPHLITMDDFLEGLRDFHESVGSL